jgi:hypothetical protein
MIFTASVRDRCLEMDGEELVSEEDRKKVWGVQLGRDGGWWVRDSAFSEKWTECLAELHRIVVVTSCQWFCIQPQKRDSEEENHEKFCPYGT